MTAGSVQTCAGCGGGEWLHYAEGAIRIGACEHHAFRDAETHFARWQIGNHHDLFPDQRFRRIGTADAGKNIAGLCFADVKR